MSIADEETMYIVTEGLVERGSLAQLEEAQAGDAPRVVIRGREGHLYAPTGPLQSLLAVPLYVVGGWVAQAFPAPFYSYFTRFFVCLLNGPVCAATVALLYLFSVDLGWKRRTAVFLALAYGLATVAWPYARTFFAETLHTFWLVLAAWAAYRYTSTDCLKWVVVVGVAMGLGVATKYVMAVAGLAFALYFLLELWQRSGWRARWRWMVRTLLAGGLPCVLIICALVALNYARFDGPTETGYTIRRGPIDTWFAAATPLISLYGLFFSSGKGFFFFSPPAVLSLWGLPALARRRRNEMWLFLTVAAVYPFFYSMVAPRWHGGGNWGPRYIVCITPFLVLPIGAFLERRDLARWWRIGATTVLFVLGFWIQMSTIFVSYGTYLFSNIPDEKQLYYPSDSPLLAQWRLWPRRVAAWQQYDHTLRASGEQFYVVDKGVYDVEVPEMAPFGRWMKDKGRLRIYAQPVQSLTVKITYSRPRSADEDGTEWKGLHLIYDGIPVEGERLLVADNPEETQWVETLELPAKDVHVFPGTLEMTATTWTPSVLGDPRELSIFVQHIDVLGDEMPLAFREADLPRPMPVTTAYPWSWRAMLWFYNPATPYPFDVWPWHVWASGVPLSRARAFVVILALTLGGALAASATWFTRTLRRSLSE